MKIVHKYVIREFFEALFFGVLVFTGILMIDQIFQFINLILGKGVPLSTVSALFFLILPNILSFSIPMAVLFGILLSFGRLSEDNEITALRSAGLKYFNFTVPVLILVAALSVLLFYFNQYLSPKTYSGSMSIYHQILTQQPLIKFEEKAITKLDDYQLYVERKSNDNNTLYGVNIYKFEKSSTGAPFRISASSAQVTVNDAGIVFHLFNGYWQKADPATPESLVHLNFARYTFIIPLGKNVLPTSQSLREMDAKTLSRQIEQYKQKNMPTNFLENEFWLRIILAVAPFIFALVGIPLGIVTERGGKGIDFGMTLLILFSYYLLLVIALNIGEGGLIPPRFILWLPNLLTLLTGLLLWRQLLKK
jgi:lipopolysaccharide export system permease protein